MADDQGEKTEKPSAKRLKEARERGQVATSRDLSTALSSLAATGVLVAAGAVGLHRLSSAVAEGLNQFATNPTRTLSLNDLTPMVMSGGTLIAITVGPIAIATASVGVLSSVLQSGFNVSMTALQPNWGRLSPKNGLGKLAPSKAGLDTLKALVVASVIGVLAWRVGSDVANEAPRLSWMVPVGAFGRGWESAILLLWRVSFALLAFGALDYGVQRWRLTSSLKMTKQDLKDEAKNNETNPEVKARVRRIQRDMVRRRMFHNVPRATVVLTNPTHYAVALEYSRDKNAAPIVIAKGADLVAARIREIARNHSVPIIENPPLTRALFKECEIGDTIPGPLFGAVAEILAYLIRIKQLAI